MARNKTPAKADKISLKTAEVSSLNRLSSCEMGGSCFCVHAQFFDHEFQSFRSNHAMSHVDWYFGNANVLYISSWSLDQQIVDHTQSKWHRFTRV